MAHLTLKTSDGKKTRFWFYERKAPLTSMHFSKALPFEAMALQARFAGEEIWIPKGPTLKIPEENATDRPKFGEISIVPVGKKNKVAKSIAIVYGEAKLADFVNVFAKVFYQDRKRLKKLGEKIWLKGRRKITFKLTK